MFIGVLFRFICSDVGETGLDGFCSICQTRLFSQKASYDHVAQLTQVTSGWAKPAHPKRLLAGTSFPVYGWLLEKYPHPKKKPTR